MNEALLIAKGHGTENDFVLVRDPHGRREITPALVRALCDRRAGLGGDGLIRVVRSEALPEGSDQADQASFGEVDDGDLPPAGPNAAQGGDVPGTLRNESAEG